jgi:hypothetical protein
MGKQLVEDVGYRQDQLKELDSVSCFQNRYLGYKFGRQQRHNE